MGDADSEVTELEIQNGAAKPMKKRSRQVAAVDPALAHALTNRERPTSLGDIEDAVRANAALLEHLAERANQEQDWFWSRFSAFATLHAGFFVLITSNVFQNQRAQYWFSLGGVTLAAAWFLVQVRSLAFVMKTKEPYRTYREILGLKAPDDTPFRWIPSATSIGVATSAIVFFAWLFAAFLLDSQ